MSEEKFTPGPWAVWSCFRKKNWKLPVVYDESGFAKFSKRMVVSPKHGMKLKNFCGKRGGRNENEMFRLQAGI